MDRVRARRVGCSVQPTPGGKLRFRFRWPLPGEPKPYYHGETTALDDTAENRTKLAASCETIGTQINDGTFDYLAWFPSGRKAHAYLRQRMRAKERATGTVRSYFDAWLEMQPARVAHTTLTQYRSHFRKTGGLLEILGDRPVVELTRSDVEYARAVLVKSGLDLKTVQNIVGGSFRALIRSALDDGLLERDPFLNVRWKRTEAEGGDPYSEDELAKAMPALRSRRFRVGRGTGHYSMRDHFPYFAAARVIEWTGMRPEEVVALQVRDFEPKRPGFLVRRAAVSGKVGATKTLSAERWVAITPETVKLVRRLARFNKRSDAWIFKAPEGGRMDQGKLGDAWGDACREAKIASRGLYSLKDTFCSRYISSPGATWEWLSEQTGVAITTLKRHYARFERAPMRDVEELERMRGKGGKGRGSLNHG